MAGVIGAVARALTEGELVALARSGDGDAYASLVRAHQDIAFRTAMLITQDAAEAEEAAQDAFVKAWRALARFRDRRAAAAVAADDRRQRGAQPAPLGRPPQRAGAARAEPERVEDRSAEAQVIAAESRAALLGALSRLRDDDRLVLGCRYLLELSRGRDRGRARRAAGHREVAHLARARAPARGGDGVTDLEHALRELDVEWPATPDLAAAVRTRARRARAARAGVAAGAAGGCSSPTSPRCS